MIRSIKIFLVMALIYLSCFGALAMAANSLEKYSWLLYLNKPNQAPVISSEVKQNILWFSNSVELDATVTDDPTDILSYKWTVVSGPGDVIFSNSDAEDTAAEFSAFGIYVLQLSVSDGRFTPEPVRVTVKFNFLENHINTAQQKLPANRVYPMGQKMMITAWLAESAGDMQKLGDAGFMMQGPIWDTGDLSYLDVASGKGLRAAHRLYTGSNSKNASSLAVALKDPDQRTAIVNRMRTEILRVVNNPAYDNVVDIWLTGCEELSSRGSDCSLNTSGSPSCDAWDSTFNELWYLAKFREAVETYDPRRRPLWMSDVTGVDASQLMPTHRYLDMIGPQMYLDRIGSPGRYEHEVVIKKLVGSVVQARDILDLINPTIRPRSATVSFGALYEPIPEKDTPEMIDKIIEHNLYLALNNGIQGFQIYAWYNYTGSAYADTATWNNYKDAWYKHVKRLTDYGLDDVFLWGDRRDDLTLKILSGADRSEFYNYPSISMRNIQYGDKRFVILINSSMGDVQIEVSNFPIKCVNLLNIREQKYVENDGSINIILQPYGVSLYRFDPVDACSI